MLPRYLAGFLPSSNRIASVTQLLTQGLVQGFWSLYILRILVTKVHYISQVVEERMRQDYVRHGSLPEGRAMDNSKATARLEERTELVTKRSNGAHGSVLIEHQDESSFKSTHLIEYHRAFFLIGFYLCIVPYKLVKQSDGIFILKGNRVQKIFCILVQGLVCYEYFSIVRALSWTSIDGTPMSYLHTATLFASLLYVVFFVYVVWAKAHLWGKMYKELQILEFANPGPNSYAALKIRLLCIGFCTFAACVASTDLMIHDGLFITETVYGTYKRLSCRAKSYYLFRECFEHMPTQEIPDNEGFLEHFVTAMHLIILIPNLIMVHTVDVVVVLTAICMWHVLRDFIKDSKKESTAVLTSLRYYESLKRLVVKMNAAVGLLTFSAIAISLPFYASWGAIVFNDNTIDWLYLIHVSTYFLNFFTILAFGADFNFKVGEFYGRITAPNVSNILPKDRLTGLLMDMYSNQISMRGCGFFVMTYRFFGTILSLIVTYSIIILQFQFSRRSMHQVNCTYWETATHPIGLNMSNGST